MQLTGSCYAFYALRKEQRVIPAKEKPPDCLVVAFFYYKNIYLHTNNIASIYINGVILFAFLQHKLMTT